MTDIMSNASGNPAVVSFDHNHGHHGDYHGGHHGMNLDLGTFADLVRDINKGASENHLETIKSHGHLAEKIAEQKCEFKDMMREQCSRLEGLVRDIDTERTKLALANATAELLAIKYANGITVTPATIGNTQSNRS